MTSPRDRQCPDGETIAALAEGRLARRDVEALLPHIESCASCRTELALANETFHEEAQPRRARPRMRWALVAAAAAVAIALFLTMRSRSPIDAMARVAPRSARMIEPRLSGPFAYAPYRGAMRSDDPELEAQQLRLGGAAGEIIQDAARDRAPAAQHAAGVAYVLVDQPMQAIERLRAATSAAPNDARAWNDLAAAQYTAALTGRASLFPEALASAGRALALDADLAAAAFNRALILERLGLRGEARAAWQRYLQKDPSSPWAAEAREHLARLDAAGALPRFETEREQLENAAAAGDTPVVRALALRHAERVRAYAEVEYLGRWADALQKNEVATAARWLSVARNIGAALAATSGESLLRDAVRAIDSADPAARQRIAEAHLVYRRGRIAFSRHELAAGERDLRLAARQFAAEGDPMQLAARSYAAGTRLAQNDVAQARRELEALLVDVDAARGYLSLAGQVRWELARALMFDADWNGAAQVLTEARSRFDAAGEDVNEALVATMLAGALSAVGRPDEGWQAQVRAFDRLAAAGRVDLLDTALGGAATMALRAGRFETARALVAVSEALERSMANDLLLADTLVRKSLLETRQDAAAGVRAAREATSVALRIEDAALRARHLADADLAMAAALLGTDARRAHAHASRALEVYGNAGLTALIAEPSLVRARASLRLGDRAAARRDLDAGIRAVEQHPARVGDAVIGTGVLDAGNALFEEAIRLDLDRGDVASAFAHAERRRGVVATAASLGELRARLAGSGHAVMLLIVLPREVVSLTVTERAASAARTELPRDELETRIAADDVEALYGALIAPASRALAEARALIVVPDESLERVPFAALRDGATRRTLVEQLPVALAPNAVALRARGPAAAPATVAMVELPSGVAAGAPALPEAERELTEIARLYRSVRRVRAPEVDARAIQDHAAAADVLHIAGHTDRDPLSGGEALATAGGRVSWRAIAAMRDLPPLVVLSACNTLRRPADADRRALSLAGAFLAAGAQNVVGTLAPIGDAEARALFLALHEHLARGVAAPAALRSVQLAHIGRPGGAWRRLALLTTTIDRAL